MTNKLIVAAALSVLVSACGGTNSIAPNIVPDNTGTGPLPGDPAIIDESTGELYPPIIRVPLAGGTTDSPVSTEIYPIKRFSLQALAGSEYSIDISNHTDSQTAVTAKLRTEYCPDNVVGARQHTIPRQSTRSFEYNATANCEFIIDIESTSPHRLIINVHLSVDGGLIQDQSSHEPNNTPNSAFPIEGGAQYSSTMGSYDDVDYFSMPVIAGQTISLTVPNHNSPADNPLRLEVLNNTLNPLTQQLISSGNTAINTSINPGYTGKMYFRFFQSTEGNSRTYSFSATPEG